MRQSILALLLVAIVPMTANAQALNDFSRLAKALNKDISLVEADGTVREGRLVAAGPDGVTMRFASGTKVFKADQIASAERLKDGIGDGAIKGAIFGGLMGLLVFAGSSDDYNTSRAGPWLTSTVFYSGLGFVLDLAHTAREPIYRSPVGPPPVSKAPMSFSFRF
jgi:hypothetical protein